LTIDTSITDDTGRGRCQSIPVDARRWTLSITSDQTTIGPALNSNAPSAAYGPSSLALGPGKSSSAENSAKFRQNTTHAIRPSNPAKPTAAETSLFGKAAGAAFSASPPNTDWAFFTPARLTQKG